MSQAIDQSCVELEFPSAGLAEAELLATGITLPLFSNVLRWIEAYAGMKDFHGAAAQWALSL